MLWFALPRITRETIYNFKNFFFFLKISGSSSEWKEGKQVATRIGFKDIICAVYFEQKLPCAIALKLYFIYFI